MGAAQMIRTAGGEELVVLSRRDYDALLARAGDPEAEDRMSGHIVSAARADALVSTVQPLAAEVWDELEKPENAALDRRLLLLRKARRLTQKQLSQASGVEQSFISDIERGLKVGSQSTQERLAKVLAVDYETLTSVEFSAA